MDPLLVSVADAARLLGIGKTEMYELVARGEFQRVRIGRRVLIPVQGLEEWVEQHTQASRMATPGAQSAEILSIPARQQRTA